MLNNDNNLESGPDKTPDEIHDEALAGIDVLWKSKQINFGMARSLIARADMVYEMTKKAAPEEYDLTTDGAINHLWRTGRINFRGVRKPLHRATMVRRIRTRIVEKAIRGFILKGVTEGIFTPEQESPLIEFLLESYLEDFI